ncbi:MAG: hypothetical protein JWQ81_6512 [Amycolatopsis sp.]|uniref:RRQRL motif-containing zinc-binding protein n=1 Tax=Amycolatopsis sp. TaxID=37632 RepID=UPI002607510D|nr:RRQRL motif-containing zinc-binding protein [Amycolatopsis sp.]MCU1685773.1 hypothetical protein [Amycolatopsis sp.]
MSGRQFPWDLRAVPWSDCREFTRGTWEGTILLSWGTGPHTLLATKRQLRKRGLRPGGQDPVAVLYFRCRRAAKQVFANLYLIALARPVRPMTPARWAALDKAMAARRTCRTCGETGYAELPKAHRTCEACLYSGGRLDPDSYLHDFLTGTPTFTADDHADLDRRSRPAPAGVLAPVVPIPRAPSRVDGAHLRKVVA